MPLFDLLTLAQDTPPTDDPALDAGGTEGTTTDLDESVVEGLAAGQSAIGKLLEGDTSGMSDFMDAYGPQLVSFGAKLAGAILLLIAALIISGWLKARVEKMLGRTKFDPTLTKFFAAMTRWIVLIVVGLMCLTIFGIETTSFAALIAAAGLAIGLAFQGTLSSFAAGVMLLTFRPFKVGDVCVLNGQLCKIAEISLFVTNVDTLDNRRVIMPNSAVFGSTIEIITYHPQRRIEVLVGVSYDADIDKTREVLEHVCAKRDDIIEAEGRGYMVVLDNLGGSSVDWKIWYWAEASDFLAIKQSLIRDIKNDLDAAGIGIPYPQMDVHLDGAVHNTHEK